MFHPADWLFRFLSLRKKEARERMWGRKLNHFHLFFHESSNYPVRYIYFLCPFFLLSISIFPSRIEEMRIRNKREERINKKEERREKRRHELWQELNKMLHVKLLFLSWDSSLQLSLSFLDVSSLFFFLSSFMSLFSLFHASSFFFFLSSRFFLLSLSTSLVLLHFKDQVIHGSFSWDEAMK